ncbi:hypothetical protein, partial [Enterobacter hormaechei]|uniref:hypothetical protein n=1 Tax=Enterobacter hormaechei TaxID=158836 RepID=UPI00203D10B4
LAYGLKGTVAATPQEKKQRSFDISSRSTLNQAPGLPGVLRLFPPSVAAPGAALPCPDQIETYR